MKLVLGVPVHFFHKLPPVLKFYSYPLIKKKSRQLWFKKQKWQHETTESHMNMNMIASKRWNEWDGAMWQALSLSLVVASPPNMGTVSWGIMHTIVYKKQWNTKIWAQYVCIQRSPHLTCFILNVLCPNSHNSIISSSISSLLSWTTPLLWIPRSECSRQLIESRERSLITRSIYLLT